MVYFTKRALMAAFFFVTVVAAPINLFPRKLQSERNWIEAQNELTLTPGVNKSMVKGLWVTIQQIPPEHRHGKALYKMSGLIHQRTNFAQFVEVEDLAEEEKAGTQLYVLDNLMPSTHIRHIYTASAA